MLNHTLSRRTMLKAGAAFVATTTLAKAQPLPSSAMAKPSALDYTRMFPELPGAKFASEDLSD